MLFTRKAQVEYAQADHEDIFQSRRLWGILGLIGYKYRADIVRPQRRRSAVFLRPHGAKCCHCHRSLTLPLRWQVLEAANILTLLETDEAKLALASQPMERIIHLREDFRDAISPNYESTGEDGFTVDSNRHKERVSWVVLKYLLQQARAWSQKTELTQPSLVHVMMGWPKDQEFGPGPGLRGSSMSASQSSALGGRMISQYSLPAEVSERVPAFPCASAAILPKADAFACGAAAGLLRRDG